MINCKDASLQPDLSGAPGHVHGKRQCVADGLACRMLLASAY